jgi:predicted component of type VI protein secretion system
MKLVLLSAGMTGRTCELRADKTTIGRNEDNAFQIAEPSVSSHHCEVLLRGTEVRVRDLDSTNGTYINGVATTESVLKPGEILRLGEVQMRLETDTPSAPGKKHFDRTEVIPGGVSQSDFDQTARGPGFDTKAAGFSKRTNKVNRIFAIVGLIIGLVIGVLLLYIFSTIRK